MISPSAILADNAHWPLQQVEARILRDSVSAATGLTLSGAPQVMHYSAQQEVLIWPLRSE